MSARGLLDSRKRGWGGGHGTGQATLDSVVADGARDRGGLHGVCARERRRSSLAKGLLLRVVLVEYFLNVVRCLDVGLSVHKALCRVS